MKKLLLILFTLYSSFFTLCAQTWQPVGNGLSPGGYVSALFVYDSVMYAGGLFTSPGNNIAQWNDSTWDTLGSGINNQVYAFARYKGLIYIGGWFSKAGGHSAGSIATWNGTDLSNPGINIEGGDGVYALHAYDTLLYIGGDAFDSINHKFLITNGQATWDGYHFYPLGTDTFTTSNYVNSMVIYDNHLCLTSSSYNYSIVWNPADNDYFGQYPEDAFSSNPTYISLNYINFALNALAVCNGKLYVGGVFNRAGKSMEHNISEWKDSTWTKLDSGINGTVYALISCNNMLIAGGSFDSAGGLPANNIAMWNGSSWSAIGNGLNGTVYALAVFNNKLYAGGNFTSPGEGIAVLDTLPVIPVNASNDSANVFPNPCNGKFTVVCPVSSTGSYQTMFQVYNILGEEIYSTLLVTETTQIDLEAQPAGIYIYRIFTDNNVLIEYGKIVIE